MADMNLPLYPELEPEDKDWKQEVYKKLAQIFNGKNSETLLRVLFFLEKTGNGHGSEELISESWKTLKCTLAPESIDVFTRYAVCLSEESKYPELNTQFRSTLVQIYEEMNANADEPIPEDVCEGFDLVRITDFDISRCKSFPELANAWKVIPLSGQSDILYCIQRMISTNKKDIWATDGVVARPEDIVQPDNALVSTLLSFESMVHVRRWWRGEISVSRCGKNMVDSTVGTAAGVAGAVTGAAVGVAAGVVIGVVGGAVGGALVGAKITHFVVSGLCEKMTATLFGVPREEALENAYKFLGVDINASNEEVNEAYKKLCLKYHPDKGGDEETFVLLQVHMGVIKAARDPPPRKWPTTSFM